MYSQDASRMGPVSDLNKSGNEESKQETETELDPFWGDDSSKMDGTIWGSDKGKKVRSEEFPLGIYVGYGKSQQLRIN